MFICKKKSGHVHFVWWYLCKTLSPNKVLFFELRVGAWRSISHHGINTFLQSLLEGTIVMKCHGIRLVFDNIHGISSHYTNIDTMVFPLVFHVFPLLDSVQCKRISPVALMQLPPSTTWCDLHQVKTPSASPI